MKLKVLGSQKEELAFSLAQPRSSADFAEKALADGDDIQLVAMKQQLIQRLAHLNALQVQCKSRENDRRNLQLDKTIMGDIDKMVTLVHTYYLWVTMVEFVLCHWRVDGEDVPGCPFTWTVKPEVNSLQAFGQLTSSSTQDGHEEGKHGWKVMCLRV